MGFGNGLRKIKIYCGASKPGLQSITEEPCHQVIQQEEDIDFGFCNYVYDRKHRSHK